MTARRRELIQELEALIGRPQQVEATLRKICAAEMAAAATTEHVRPTEEGLGRAVVRIADLLASIGAHEHARLWQAGREMLDRCSQVGDRTQRLDCLAKLRAQVEATMGRIG